jgi:hypothetical protein
MGNQNVFIHSFNNLYKFCKARIFEKELINIHI